MRRKVTISLPDVYADALARLALKHDGNASAAVRALFDRLDPVTKSEIGLPAAATR
jgi:hypothetical protein